MSSMTQAAVSRETSSAIGLLRAAPELGRGIPEADRPLAQRVLAVPALTAPAGAWTPPPRDECGDGAHRLLIYAGIMTRETLVGDRAAAALFGPGDVIDPWRVSDDAVDAPVRWIAGDDVCLAVLDRRVTLAGQRWPSIAMALRDRIAMQGERALMLAALTQLTPIELRVLGILWHLAGIWGHTTPQGIVLPLKLTHEAVGRLAGAQRPTVTLGLGALARDGAVERRRDGSWLLRHGSQAALRPAGPLRHEPAPTHVEAPVTPSDAPAAAFPPASYGADDLRELKELLDELRQSAAPRRQQLERLISDCRATVEHGHALRERVSADRERLAELRRVRDSNGG
jgi:hypothetical protein